MWASPGRGGGRSSATRRTGCCTPTGRASIPSRFIDELPEEHVERAGSAAMAREQRLTAPSVFTGQFPLTARRPKVTEVWEQPARPPRDDR